MLRKYYHLGRKTGHFVIFVIKFWFFSDILSIYNVYYDWPHFVSKKKGKILKSLKTLWPWLYLFTFINTSYGSFAYIYILSISGWWLFGLSNAFVIPDPESPIINIIYGWLEYIAVFDCVFLCFLLQHFQI